MFRAFRAFRVFCACDDDECGPYVQDPAFPNSWCRDSQGFVRLVCVTTSAYPRLQQGLLKVERSEYFMSLVRPVIFPRENNKNDKNDFCTTLK